MSFCQITTTCKQFSAIYFVKLTPDRFQRYQDILVYDQNALYGLDTDETNFFTARIEDKCFEDLKEVAHEVLELEKNPNTLTMICLEDDDDPDLELAKKWKLPLCEKYSFEFRSLYEIVRDNPLGKYLLKQAHADGRVQKPLFVVFARHEYDIEDQEDEEYPYFKEEQRPFSTLDLQSISVRDLPRIEAFHPLAICWGSAHEKLSFCTLDMTVDEFAKLFNYRRVLEDHRQVFVLKGQYYNYRFLLYPDGVYDFVLDNLPCPVNSNVKFP